jgi:hypothetical protein
MLILNTLSFHNYAIKALQVIKVYPSVPLLPVAVQMIRVIVYAPDVNGHMGATAPMLEHTPQTLVLAV